MDVSGSATVAQAAGRQLVRCWVGGSGGAGGVLVLVVLDSAVTDGASAGRGGEGLNGQRPADWSPLLLIFHFCHYQVLLILVFVYMCEIDTNLGSTALFISLSKLPNKKMYIC